MAYDSIKQRVETYKAKKNDYDTEFSEFSEQFSDFKSATQYFGNLDSDISADIDQINSEFEEKNAEFENKLETLLDEKKETEGDINNELEKINAAKSKLLGLVSAKYGSAVSKPIDITNDYNKKYDDLLNQLGTDGSHGGGSFGSGPSNDSFYNPTDNNFGQSKSIPPSAASSRNISSAVQSAHKSPVYNFDGIISAVQADVSTSNISLTTDQAMQMAYSVQNYTGGMYGKIRSAYGNPNAGSHLNNCMNQLDSYLRSAPKWQGTIYRGINVSDDVISKFQSDGYVDMLGPSSWSSDKTVSDRFTRGQNNGVMFRLKNNKSGASVSHISSFPTEKEVAVPSGVIYRIDAINKIKDSYGKIMYLIDVSE